MRITVDNLCRRNCKFGFFSSLGDRNGFNLLPLCLGDINRRYVFGSLLTPCKSSHTCDKNNKIFQVHSFFVFNN